MNVNSWRIVALIALCTACFSVSACNVSDNTNLTFGTDTRTDAGISGGGDASTEDASAAQDASSAEDASSVEDATEEDTSGAADAGEDAAGDDDATDTGDDDASDTGGIVDDCTLAADDTPCGETLIGGPAECVYRGVCSQTGVRTQTRTLRVCESGACVDRDDSVMEICGSRDTEGQTCGDTQIGRTTVCTRIDQTQCGKAGQELGTNTYFRCDDQGTCAQYPEQVSILCEVNPDGRSCGEANDGTCYGTCCEEPCPPGEPCRLCPRLL